MADLAAIFGGVPNISVGRDVYDGEVTGDGYAIHRY
jgi:hypothetical protein